MEVLGRLCLSTQSVGENPSGHSAWGQPGLNCMILLFNLFRDFMHEILQRT